MLSQITAEKAASVSNQNHNSARHCPPGPKGLPLAGNLFSWLRDPLGFYTRNARTFGDVVRARIAPGLVSYQLYYPDHVEEVLRHNHRQYRKDFFTRQLSSILGQSLLTSDGEAWRSLRRLVQPAFAMQEIQHYGQVMTAFTERMLQSWKAGEKRDIHQDMMRVTLEIVAKTLFDVDIRGEAKAVGDALETLMDYFGNLLNWSGWMRALPTPANRRFHQAQATLDEVINNLIQKRRAGDNTGNDLLSRLIHAEDGGLGLTDQQLRGLTMTLILAGHETTALVLSYAVHMLATHPEAAANVAAELKSVLDLRTPESQDVPRLVYTEWVVRETMRLYPPAWGMGRQPIEDVEIGGYVIPEGALVELIPWVVHRDPRWFDDPEQFQPERWDNDLARRLPRGAYFPFGDGPRICVGNNFAMMEAILILATVFQRFRFTPAPGYKLQLLPSVTLRPKHGVRVIVENA